MSLDIQAKLLPHEEKSEVFGEKYSFWSRYDRLAEMHDKDMLGRLNDDLDVLLIFAGLFSAINTAFIVVALSGLSANPANDTNVLLTALLMHFENGTYSNSNQVAPFVPTFAAVRQNCTFLASLSTSLVVAAGAVLAKQWLGVYERTGQVGSLESQSLHRMEKFLGAEAWHLRHAVESLPFLLLTSLALFFIALTDYLWSINHTVSVVVLVLSLLGFLAYQFTLIAAAISPLCPFQTPVSKATRITVLKIKGLWEHRAVPALAAASRSVWENLKRGARYISESPVYEKLQQLADKHLTTAWTTAGSTLRTVLYTITRFRRSALAGDGPRSSELNGDRHGEEMSGSVSRLDHRNLLDMIQGEVSGAFNASVYWGKQNTQTWFTRLSSLLPMIPRLTAKYGESLSREEELYTYSLLWMLEVASENDDLRAVAENIPALHNLTSVQAISRSPLFPRLITRYRDAITSGDSNALAFTKAVAHILAADPLWCYRMIWDGLEYSDGAKSELVSFLKGNASLSVDALALHGGITALCCRCFRDYFQADPKNRSSHEQAVYEAFVAPSWILGVQSKRAMFERPTKRAISSTKDIQRSTLVSLMTLLASSGVSDQTEILVGDLPPDDTFFDLASLTISLDGSAIEAIAFEGRIKDIWLARTGRSGGHFMNAALDVDITTCSPVQLSLYTTLIRRFLLHHPEANTHDVPHRRGISAQQISPWNPAEIFSSAIRYDHRSLRELRAAEHQASKRQRTIATTLSRTSLAFIEPSAETDLHRTQGHNDASSFQPPQSMLSEGRAAFLSRLRTFALQLLLCLDCSELVGPWNLSDRHVRAIGQTLITLELDPRDTMSDREVDGLVKVLVRVVFQLPLADTMYIICNPSITPIIVSAMASRARVKASFLTFLHGDRSGDEMELSRLDTSQAVFKLLDQVGLWIMTPRSIQTIGFIGVPSQLGYAIIQNLSKNLSKASIDATDLYGITSLFRWLTESISVDAELRASLRRAGVSMLFARGVATCLGTSMTEEEMVAKRSARARFLLHLGLLYTGTHANAMTLELLEGRPAGSFIDEMGVEWKEFTILAKYMQEYMQTEVEEVGSSEVRALFEQTFSLVEEAFTFDPNAASAAGLDLESESLITQLIEMGLDHVFVYLRPAWERARMTYLPQLRWMTATALHSCTYRHY
ncbi:hypothetical protein FRB96_002343 [Tulasnella sp. 330]|nr:hypothetical protein FRB96_002343 [Tulasnella sp. 330]